MPMDSNYAYGGYIERSNNENPLDVPLDNSLVEKEIKKDELVDVPYLDNDVDDGYEDNTDLNTIEKNEAVTSPLEQTQIKNLGKVFTGKSFEELKHVVNLVTNFSTKANVGIVVPKSTFDVRQLTPEDTLKRELYSLFHTNTNEFGNQIEQVYIMAKAGSGAYKQNYKAIETGSDKVRAISIAKYTKETEKSINEEIAFHKELRDVKGCVCAKTIIYSPTQVALIAPFCDKGTMADAMESFGEPSDEEIVKEFSQLASTLDELHTTKQIIHGDIKPDNIMYKSSKKSLESKVKLIDWGVSRKLDKTTSPTSPKGPIWVMAPEVLKTSSLFKKFDELRTKTNNFRRDINTKIEKVSEEMEQLAYEIYDLNREADPSTDPQILRSKEIKVKELSDKQDELINARDTLLQELNIEMTAQKIEILEAYNNINDKSDVFMLGLTMYSRRNQGEVPPIYKKLKVDVFTPNCNRSVSINTALQQMDHAKEIIPEPSKDDKIDHIIWEMLQIDPAKRPAMKEVADRLNSISV